MEQDVTIDNWRVSLQGKISTEIFVHGKLSTMFLVHGKLSTYDVLHPHLDDAVTAMKN